MARYTVTLKSTLERGSFYWVCTVEADGEEEAVVAAENLFEAETENAGEWSFQEYDVEKG